MAAILFQVEGLLEDVDFRLKVTREELDAMCSDLYDRVQEPVRQALAAADMTLVCEQASLGARPFSRKLDACSSHMHICERTCYYCMCVIFSRRVWLPN